MEVVTPHNNRPLHLGRDNDPLQNLSPDRNVASEGAFFVDIPSFDGFLGGFESQSDILEVPDSSRGLLGQQLLAIQEHVFLFLEGSFVLKLD